MRTAVTVRRALRFEVVTLDRAGETFTNGGAGYVDLLASFENAFDSDHATRREFGCASRIETEFFEDATGFYTSFGVMTGLRLGYTGSATSAVSNLNGGVAVRLKRLYLGDAVVRHVQYCYGDGLAIFRKNTGHADLAAHQPKPMCGRRGCRFRHHILRGKNPIPDYDWSGLIKPEIFGCSCTAKTLYDLFILPNFSKSCILALFFDYCSAISTSTPAGKSKRINASTVLSVGSTMSIRRWCVRISNWSRDVLFTCGERNTS